MIFRSLMDDKLAKSKKYGDYTRTFVSDIPADLSSALARHYNQTIPRFPNEGVYIYSFQEGRMLYADGWPEVIGKPNEAITMLGITTMTAPEHEDFVHEINDKGLQFLHANPGNDIDQYSFTIEIKVFHEDGSKVPVVARVGVFEGDEKGELKSIIGRFQYNPNLRFGKVMSYSAYGPDVAKFEAALDPELFQSLVITDKEKEALSLAAEGFALKEIASKLNVSQSAIEKRIIPLYRRFNVRNLPHLVSFAYRNFILD